MTKYFRFKALFQKNRWLQPAYVGVDQKGKVTYVSDTAPAEGLAYEAVEGFALPGFQNAHSHAFQYAMAGLAENHPAGTTDDFWSWREAMYRCALSVDPDQAEAIAAMVYAEMLRNGYTHVAEFHYLHHDKDAKPYSNLAEMGERMIRAAFTAGIKITLIPVFYQKGNFGTNPFPSQRRFTVPTVDQYFRLLDASAKIVKTQSSASLGFSVHSLRAVDAQDIIRTYKDGPNNLPFHLHVAEQKKEVEDCLAFCGKRPMEWLFDNLPVDARFNLVHSTHLDDKELKMVAKSGATVILCPSTEGNLGDGIFRMKEYVGLGGRWCIGSDSHIGLNPMEEFRMIDYRQRLVSNKRNTFDNDAASYMMSEEIERGRKAMGLTGEPFSTGQPFDAIVFNEASPLVAHTGLSNLASTLVFTSDSDALLGTICDGQWLVKNRRHVRQEEIRKAFAIAMKTLRNR